MLRRRRCWAGCWHNRGKRRLPFLICRAALQTNPGYVEARLTLAGVLAQLGKVAEAEQEARRAVKEAPSNAEAHRTLARILSQHAGDEALAEMRRAVELASAASGVVR